MRFTIITATVMRPSLSQTCWSVESQSHADWQHLVMVDVPGATIPKFMKHPQREWVICDQAHGHFGNHCRNLAYPLIRGDYVMNMDDDDFYLDGAFEALEKALSGRNADWAVFPAVRMGYRFFNVPPGHSLTMNNQFVYRPVINGLEIRFPDNHEYCADGEMIEWLKKIADPVIIDGPELVQVSRISQGAR